MEFSWQLTTEQQLKLQITPALKQSIDILQLPMLDLTSFLQEIAAENPVIEIENIDRPDYRKKKETRKPSQQPVDVFSFISNRPDTLEEIISEQLRYMKLPDHLLRAASFLAGNLSDDGYLDIDLETAGGLVRQPLSVMEEALTVLQELDPPGIGARNLQECLHIQIERDKHAPDIADTIVQHHFVDFAYSKFAVISRKLKIPVADVEDAAAYIRQLNPRPGLAYCGSSEPQLIPDGEISVRNGQIHVQLYNDFIPKISINREYKQWADEQYSNSATPYLKEKINHAEWLIKSLNNRKSTLRRVLENIVEKQKDFFLYGEHHLRPLTLKEVSVELSLHESTVSRAVQHKSIQTPKGIMLIKSFFSSGLIQAQGQSVSQTSVKVRIRDMIEQESKQKPLSDQQIADSLKEEGYSLSRRTVAKYRDEMRILPSSLRKNV